MTPQLHVQLNVLEVAIAKRVGRARYEESRRAGIPDEKKGPQSNEQTDIEGFAAELAASKAHNVYPDFDVHERPAWDLISRNHWLIDVKATPYENGRVLATLNKVNKPPDYYCLVIGQLPAYRIAGYIPASELLRDERIDWAGHSFAYVAKQGELLTHEMFVRLPSKS